MSSVRVDDAATIVADTAWGVTVSCKDLQWGEKKKNCKNDGV